MRTTVNLDPEVVAAAELLRREEGLGISEAVNLLARRGLAMQKTEPKVSFAQKTYPGRLLVDITHNAHVLDLLDEWDREEREQRDR
ncbi:MAG: hypothetical protein ABI632_03245 [Pseudolysinimonas sp.]